MADITERLNEHFRGKLYSKEEMVEFLKGMKYTEIYLMEIMPPQNIKNLKSMKVFQMDFYKEKRTLFVGIDEKGSIQLLRMKNATMDSFPNDTANGIIGCIILLAILGFLIWALVSCVATGIDSFDDDDEDYNPYTEDFDGDGLKGDKDDHNILHQMPTLPDGD
jgi:hypothetical protein